MAHENQGARWRRHVEQTTPRTPTVRALEAMKDLIDISRVALEARFKGEFIDGNQVHDLEMRLMAAEDAYAEVTK